MKLATRGLKRLPWSPRRQIVVDRSRRTLWWDRTKVTPCTRMVARFIPQGGVLRERLETALVCEAGGYSPDEKTFELPSTLLRAAMHSGLIGP